MRGLIDERLRAAGHDPSALYQELEMDSPYVDTHDDVSRTMDTVNLHSHTFYELLFVRGRQPAVSAGHPAATACRRGTLCLSRPTRATGRCFWTSLWSRTPALCCGSARFMQGS